MKTVLALTEHAVGLIIDSAKNGKKCWTQGGLEGYVAQEFDVLKVCSKLLIAPEFQA